MLVRRALLCRIRLHDPGSGSAYTYAYATMGRFMAWFIGWNMVLEYLVSASAVAVGWSGYFTELMHTLHSISGISSPARLCVVGDPPPCRYGHRLWASSILTGAMINLPAVLLILGSPCSWWWACAKSANTNGVMVG